MLAIFGVGYTLLGPLILNQPWLSKKQSRIQETLNLSTNADRSTDTKKSPKILFLKKKIYALFLKIVSLQVNIRNTPFDQKSPPHLEVGVLCLRAYEKNRTHFLI